MSNNFYEGYSLKRIIDSRMEVMFTNLGIKSPEEKFKHVELICGKILEDTEQEDFYKLSEIINEYLTDKKEKLFGKDEQKG